MSAVSFWPGRDERSVRARASGRNRGRDDETSGGPSMTDRDVEALSAFLRHLGSFGCRQIGVRRTEPKPRTPEDVGQFVLETLAPGGLRGSMPSGCTESPRSRFTSTPT